MKVQINFQVVQPMFIWKTTNSRKYAMFTYAYKLKFYICMIMKLPKFRDFNIAQIQLIFTCRQNNQIRKIEGLENLQCLEKLYLDRNYISKLEGLDKCICLGELHISEQNLMDEQKFEFDEECLQYLSNCLTHLSIAKNEVCDLSMLGNLKRLRCLNVSRNKVSKKEGIEQFLNKCYELRKLDLRDNPICKTPKYRDFVILQACSALDSLDDKSVLAQDKNFVEKLHNRKPITQPQIQTNRIASGELLPNKELGTSLSTFHNKLPYRKTEIRNKAQTAPGKDYTNLEGLSSQGVAMTIRKHPKTAPTAQDKL
eukprot:TRINITY_DN30500_c0_g1_i1.p2 TRINITY_DN30500_c0_g1~~TRINITY_DN30500_c0_g1_i1.p2  ORF type:complete len:312 (-),score=20.29 TRINITY_DN30500_c0_g1_i1:218-1153(-)